MKTNNSPTAITPYKLTDVEINNITKVILRLQHEYMQAHVQNVTWQTNLDHIKASMGIGGTLLVPVVVDAEKYMIAKLKHGF